MSTPTHCGVFPLPPVQVEVYKSFRPGDIVLAKVVSFPLLPGGPRGLLEGRARRGQGVFWSPLGGPFP